jgi:hypothetical protein
VPAYLFRQGQGKAIVIYSRCEDEAFSRQAEQFSQSQPRCSELRPPALSVTFNRGSSRNIYPTESCLPNWTFSAEGPCVLHDETRSVWDNYSPFLSVLSCARATLPYFADESGRGCYRQMG